MIESTTYGNIRKAANMIYGGVQHDDFSPEVWIFEKLFMTANIQDLPFSKIEEVYEKKFYGLSSKDLLINGEWYEAVQDLLINLSSQGHITAVSLDEDWEGVYDVWGIPLS